MKKVIWIIFGLTATLLLYQFTSSSTSATTKPTNINDEMEVLEAPALEEEEVLFPDDLFKVENIEQEPITEMNLSLEEVVPEIVIDETEEVKDIMVEADIEEVKKHFPTKEGIAPVIAVEVLKNSVSSLKVGDTISLPYMGSGEYEATITSTTTHKNGSISVSGNLADFGNKYSVVLTEGKSMTFGTVTTPNGSFEIETKDGQGYVYSTDSIDNKWIDYTKSDTLHSENEHNH